MTIIEDTGQKVGQHDNVREYCERNNIIFRRQKLNVGDYQSPPRAAVDTKKGLSEVYSNLVHDHGRFKEECIRAQEDGIKLYILVEEKCVRELCQVQFWKNPLQKVWDQKKSYHDWQTSTCPPKTSSFIQKAYGNDGCYDYELRCPVVLLSPRPGRRIRLSPFGND